MRIDVITVFPEMFGSVVDASMLGIARDKGLLEFHAHDLRQWALPGVHRQVDDAPYGGGAGMVLRPEPVFAAVDAVRGLDERPAHVALMSPQGALLTHQKAAELALEARLVLVCGRYEGFDERIRTIVDSEISIGDYVLTGGEVPAMVVIDAVVRLVPGVLGGETSVEEESFSDGLLEYPQYTRPASFRGMDVPEVLLSGDHARVGRWRREQAIVRTAARRPDVLEAAWERLTDDERALARRSLARTMEDA